MNGLYSLFDKSQEYFGNIRLGGRVLAADVSFDCIIAFKQIEQGA